MSVNTATGENEQRRTHADYVRAVQVNGLARGRKSPPKRQLRKEDESKRKIDVMDLRMGIKGSDFIEAERNIVGSGEVNKRRKRVGEQKRAEHQRISVDEAAGLYRRAKQHCGGSDK